MKMKHGEYMPWQMYFEVFNADLQPVINEKRKITNGFARLLLLMLGAMCMNMECCVCISPGEGKYSAAWSSLCWS
jgi:hypothetical protein